MNIKEERDKLLKVLIDKDLEKFMKNVHKNFKNKGGKVYPVSDIEILELVNTECHKLLRQHKAIWSKQ